MSVCGDDDDGIADCDAIDVSVCNVDNLVDVMGELNIVETALSEALVGG